MKKHLVPMVCIVILITAASGWSEEYQYGAGVSIDLDRYAYEDTSGDKDQENSLLFHPFLSIMLNEKMELAPYLHLYTETEKTAGEIDYKWNYIGAGSAFYYHFINRDFISLGAGVDVRLGFGYYPDSSYDSYKRINLNMTAPLFMDLNMADWLTFRFIWYVVGINLYKDTYDNGSGEQSESYAYMDSLMTIDNLELGFLIRF